MTNLSDNLKNEKRGKFIIQGNGKKRIELKQEEINALAFLETQRILTINQLYQYCRDYLLYNITLYSFKNRIRRLEEYKIIRSIFHNEPSFNSDRFKCISIGRKGIDILCNFDFLTKDYRKEDIYTFLKKRNFIHTIGVQQAVINILTYFKSQTLDFKIMLDFYKEEITEDDTYENEGTLKLASVSPQKYRYERISDFNYRYKRSYSPIPRRGIPNRSNNVYDRNRRIVRKITIIKPDWIIILNPIPRKVLNIEFDVGTEKLSDLIFKIFGYIEVCRMKPNETHGVIITLPDESFLSRNKFGDRSKRIHNIQDAIKQFPNLLNSIRETNLQIYVVSLKNIGKAALHFFTRIEDEFINECGIVNRSIK
ncbi:replication-relaxation family protein [Schinkia azotoformans]|uniref:replication-relaxation family protein n=1 Tax=Schinkia azotoformans TaxID=1454 RepID=UPI002DBB163C|nr:replication-relaxation family protein [Schinkia azotoformans]MEC1716485.1 replication-relaxation family protein [Schinkia azotoformans]MEC1756237.1 replication-relaxation family protein [Schinkia azotoformans]